MKTKLKTFAIILVTTFVLTACNGEEIPSETTGNTVEVTTNTNPEENTENEDEDNLDTNQATSQTPQNPPITDADWAAVPEDAFAIPVDDMLDYPELASYFEMSEWELCDLLSTCIGNASAAQVSHIDGDTFHFSRANPFINPVFDGYTHTCELNDNRNLLICESMGLRAMDGEAFVGGGSNDTAPMTLQLSDTTTFETWYLGGASGRASTRNEFETLANGPATIDGHTYFLRINFEEISGQLTATHIEITTFPCGQLCP